MLELLWLEIERRYTNDITMLKSCLYSYVGKQELTIKTGLGLAVDREVDLCLNVQVTTLFLGTRLPSLTEKARASHATSSFHCRAS